MSILDASLQADPLSPSGDGRSHYDEVHRRVVATLSQEIAPGERVPSDRQLAQQFGVSNVTIGRVMHDLQRAGIVQRVPGKGTYFSGETLRVPALPALNDARTASSNGLPHRVDGNAPQAKTPVAQPQAACAEAFAWIVTSFKPQDIYIPAERWVLRASSSIERAVQRAGGRTVLTNSATAADPIEVLENLRGRGVNQIIITSDQVFQDCPELGYYLLNEQEQHKGEGKPWPVVHIPLGTTPWPFDAVRFDDERGVYAAVAHLWNLGHRAIAFAAPGKSNHLLHPWVDKRVQAFGRAMMALSRGATPGVVLRGDPALEEMDWRSHGQSVGDLLLNDPTHANITGLVAANDPIAQGVMEKLRQHGRKVPEDLSVVGFDDEPWSSSLGLTTLHVPVEEMGEQAAQLALRRMAEPTPGQRIELVLQPMLVVRETTQRRSQTQE